MTSKDHGKLRGTLTLRVSQEELDIFTAKAMQITGNDYQVLIREFITSFNDGRLSISPTEDQKQVFTSIGELYNVD